MRLVSVSRGVILGADNQTTTLLGTAIDGFDDVDQFLLVLQNPVELVIVTSTEIAHHMFISKEEHKGNGIVEFVHLLKVRDLVEVADVDDGEVLHAIGDAIEDFILSHAFGIPVTTKANDNEAFLFGHDGLVDVPTCDKMREDDGAHIDLNSQLYLTV